MRETPADGIDAVAQELTVQELSPGTEFQRVLSSKQVAHWLRIATEAVEAMAVSGQLPGKLCDGEWRFGAAAINQWLGGIGGPLSDNQTGTDTILAAIAQLEEKLGAIRVEAVQEPAAGNVSVTSGRIEFAIEEPVSAADLETQYIQYVLSRCGGNKSTAAQWLGFDPSTLYRKLGRISGSHPSAI